MGVVYKAIDTATGSAVALKSLPRADPAALYRFKQEFRSLADISHPNLASLYELFAIDDGWWLAMEFVDGLDFIGHVRGYHRDQDPPPSSSGSSSDDMETSDSVHADVPGGTKVREHKDALAIDAGQLARLRSSLAQLASALDALHANDTLHRDIKPSNVMVDRSGRAVLLDFGLVTAIADSSSTGDGEAHILGTVTYMAPEQATTKALTPAADWYAVGVMLYHALSGQLPFSGPAVDVIHQKQTQDVPSLRSLNPSLPDDLIELADDLLQRDPAKRPPGAEILARLGGGDAADRGRDELFLGRESQMETLRRLLAHVGNGSPAAAFVQGRSGAGKSHLIRQVLDEARRVPNAVVLEGRCYEDESVPYKAVDSLIDALARFLVRLPATERAILAPRDAAALIKVFPVLRQVKELAAGRQDVDVPDQQELRRRAFRGLRELLARLGDRRPLLLYVDDLQWGDADSAALLGELLRPPDPPVLLLVCSYRSEYADKSVCVRALREAYAASDVLSEDVNVEPLATAEAIELAHALLPQGIANAGDRAAAIARESGGIPFFIQELARHAEGDVEEAESDSFDLDELIRRRVATLPPAAKSILEAVSVCGHPITRQALVAAADAAGDERGALRLLRTGHFVRTTGAGESDWVEPYHDRIREAVASHLTAPALRDHHRRIAASLEAAGAFDPETIAVHFEGGEILDRAGHFYGLAADAAADTLAFEHASTLYSKALNLQKLNVEDERTLRVRLADALANDGRGPDAARNYLTAAAGADARQAVDLQRRAAYQYCVSGHLEQGHATLKTLLGSIHVPVPEARGVSIARFLLQRGRNRLRGFRFSPRSADQVKPDDLLKNDLIWAASAGLSMFDVLQGAEFQSRNLYHALSIGEPHRIARALAWEAAHTSNSGAPSWPRTSRLLSEARAIAQSSGHPHSIGMAQLSTGIAEFTMGRWSSARDQLQKAEEIFRSQCTGVAWELDTGHAFELWARIYAGDFNHMSQRTASLLKEGLERGDKNAVTTLGTFMVPHIRLVSDDPDGAQAEVAKYLDIWGLDGYHLQHLTGLMSLTYIDLYRGDGRAGLDRLQAKQGWFRMGFYNTIQVLRVFNCSLIGRSALMAARDANCTRRERDGLVAMARKSARRLERERVSWVQPLAQSLQAGVAAAEGKPEQAAELLITAAMEFDQVPMEGYASAARWRAASLLKGSSRADDLKRESDRWMNREGIRNPDRMTDMLTFGAAS